MIAVLLFLNSRGDTILSRSFRDGYSIRLLADSFRNELISTGRVDRSPINILGKMCYVHLKLTDLYMVMISAANMNCVMCIQYGVRLLQVIQGYYGRINENVLKENFVALQEIIDDTMDFGYPQLTDTASLKEIVGEGGLEVEALRSTSDAERIATKIMGAVPWREEGLIYRVNELFVDVFEDVNLLLSPTGEILQSSVVGRIEMKSFLSGMPTCELLLSCRAYGAESLGSSTSLPEEGQGVQLQDVAFHTCVCLNRFDSEKQSIQFTPPDGKFTLMTYRSSIDVRPPIRLISPRVNEVAATRIVLEFTLKCDLTETMKASGVKVRVPSPENTASAMVCVTKGKAKFVPIEKAIVWKLPSVSGAEEIPFFAEIKLIAPTFDEGTTTWSRPPINIAFHCISHCITGLRVREMKVSEPVFLYTPNKWIRYTTQAGEYQCRI